MFVGEIGIPRREYLYEISFWETRCIYRGYRNRYRDMWSAIRWQTFNIMGSMPYVDMRKGGLFQPSDLIKFPWDKESAQVKEPGMPTEEEKEEINVILQKIANKEI